MFYGNYEIPKPVDSEGLPYYIRASLSDSAWQAVPGQPVSFEIIGQVGRIEYPNSVIPVTNNRGEASALFYNTEADEDLNPDHADLRAITPSLDGQGFLVATVTLPQMPAHNTLTLETADEVIGGSNFQAWLVARLRDTYGHPIATKPVRFSWQAPSGQVLDSAYTNHDGYASVAFTSFHVTQAETVQVLAEFRPCTARHASATDQIMVIPANPYGYINISLQKVTLIADGNDSSMVYITAKDSTGAFVPDGTAIYVEHTGPGFLSAPIVYTHDGRAQSKLTSPANIIEGPRIDSIFAWFNPVDSVTLADTAVVQYIPGPLAQLSVIYPETTVTLYAGTGDTCSVVMSITDASGNPVGGGNLIWFRNYITTSTLSPNPAPIVNGIATTVYQVGNGTGDDIVYSLITRPGNPNDTIRTNPPAYFRCIAGEPNYRLALSASYDTIGVGGQSTLITATLENYQPPPFEGPNVAFDLVSPVEASFDSLQDVYHDTIPTNINGQAMIQLFSRMRSGWVTIRACTVSEPPDSFSACDESTLVYINPGSLKAVKGTLLQDRVIAGQADVWSVRQQ